MNPGLSEGAALRFRQRGRCAVLPSLSEGHQGRGVPRPVLKLTCTQVPRVCVGAVGTTSEGSPYQQATHVN